MKKIFYTLLFLPFLCTAQKIETDRPTETESPVIVPICRLQFENGFYFEKDGADHTFNIPETTWRYGIVKDIELRIETAFVNDKNATTVTGIQPVTLGMKVHITEEKGILPQVSLLGRIQIPWLGSKELQGNYYTPEVRLLLQNALSKSVHLGYNIGIEWNSDTSQPDYIYTLSGDLELNKKLRVFIEAYGFTPVHHKSEESADAGFIYLLNDTIQLDVSGGIGITAAAADCFGSVGISLRI